MSLLALDIGGAYLKVADGNGYTATESFALWQQPERLADRLRCLIEAGPAARTLVVTMTGELADCYRTKADGVSQILSAVGAAAGSREVRAYLTDGQFVSRTAAAQQPLLAAASNWHALATFACRYIAEGTGLLIDIGSTTTDLVPLSPAGPLPQGQTDPERMVLGELVYTGIERSPVCAVVGAVPWRGQLCPVAHELFATTADAYVTLGDLPEETSHVHTADGRPRTKDMARDRLARSICADRDMFDSSDALAVAGAIRRAQLAKLGVAAQQVLRRLSARPVSVVISGHGEFLARELVKRLGLAGRLVSLASELGASISRAATAHALAVLAREASQP